MKMREFVQYQESTFESYCRVLIRNEGKNARKAIVRRARHEINHSMYDNAPRSDHPASEDAYDLGSVTFLVCGLPVKIDDPILGKAIASLTPYRREVVLRFYFLDQSEPQIAAHLRRNASTVNYQRSRALSRLRAALEELNYDK